MRVAWTSAALADIESIQDYIARDSPAAAYKLTAGVLDRTERLLADNPTMGRAGRVAGTRELVLSGTPYIVAYRVRSQCETVAVVHGARAWPEDF